MKKPILLLFLLLAFFNIRGQEIPFDYGEITSAIKSLEGLQQTILKQASSSADITPEDKDRAGGVLSETFDKLNKALDIYQKLETMPELQREAKEIFKGFINDFRTAVFNDDKTDITVKTNKFLTVADSTILKLDNFNNKVQDYLTNLNKEDNKIEVTYLEEEKADTKAQEKDFVHTAWFWIFMSSILLCLLLSIISLLGANSKKRDIEDLEDQLRRKASIIEINRLKEELGKIHQLLDFKLKKNVMSVPIKPIENEKKITHQKQKEKATEQKTTVASEGKSVASPVYLYATVKANSAYPEFAKIANENTGDKIFQLKLTKPEDEVADYTIVPNMPVDFIKEVIVNRDTYLPQLFCDKSIDSPNPVKIDVVKSGRAKKVDGKWQVQDRMIIRLV